MWPFSKRKAPPARIVPARTPLRELVVRKVGKNTKMLLIDTLDFRGVYADSPNGLYTISCADNHGPNGGFRMEGNGRFALISCQQILFMGSHLARPQNGQVSDSGVFILTDALFGVKTTCVFYAFAPDGSEITRFDFSAKALDTALSPDGRFAIFQLAGSETEDANCLVFVDIAEQRIAWKNSKVGWANHYEFDTSAKLLRLTFLEREAQAISFAGEMVCT